MKTFALASKATSLSSFESHWQSLVTLLEKPNSSYMAGLYNSRQKWAMCDTDRYFSADMSTTQRVESINASLKCHLGRRSTLVDVARRMAIDEKISYTREVFLKSSRVSVATSLSSITLQLKGKISNYAIEHTEKQLERNFALQRKHEYGTFFAAS